MKVFTTASIKRKTLLGTMTAISIGLMLPLYSACAAVTDPNSVPMQPPLAPAIMEQQPQRVTPPLEEPMVAFTSAPNTQQKQPQAAASNVTTVAVPINNGSINKPFKPTIVSATAVPSSSSSAAHILAVNPNYYTIQLTSDSELIDLQQFIQQHQLQDKAIYFSTDNSQGHKLYILISGEFANKADAQTALDNLAENVKAEGAFVSKYSSIQRMLSK